MQRAPRPATRPMPQASLRSALASASRDMSTANATMTKRSSDRYGGTSGSCNLLSGHEGVTAAWAKPTRQADERSEGCANTEIVEMCADTAAWARDPGRPARRLHADADGKAAGDLRRHDRRP